MGNKLSQKHFIVLFLILVVIASAGDLLADLAEGVNTTHIVQEAIILLVAIGALAWLAFDHQQQKQKIAALHDELNSAKHSAQPSKKVLEAKQNLAVVIAEQFDEWKLTESEQQIGQLLLKGFSLKEISALRGTSEKTIRQQASSIYQKSGLPGRHAFSAWFIEDFL